jgi:acetyltransferase-like isoleucine patch superfamily enzyme
MRLEVQILGKERTLSLIRGRIQRRVRIRGNDRICCGPGVLIEEGSELRVEDPGHPAAGSITLGARVRIGKQTRLIALPGDRLEIGEESSLSGYGALIGNIQVGRSVLFAANTFASTRPHRFLDQPHLTIREQDAERAHREGVFGRPQDSIVIDDDCWLGRGTVLSEGIHLGRGAVVGANAVVTADVAPYTVVGGVPARPIKARLAYSPRNRLSATCGEDRPYFYSGFAKVARPGGGLPIDRPMARVVLAGSAEATALTLIVCAQRADHVVLRFAAEALKVAVDRGQGRLVVPETLERFVPRATRPFATPCLVVSIEGGEGVELIAIELSAGAKQR